MATLFEKDSDTIGLHLKVLNEKLLESVARRNSALELVIVV